MLEDYPCSTVQNFQNCMNNFFKKKTIEGISISIFLFKKTSERISSWQENNCNGAGRLETYNFIKKIAAQMFSCKFCKMFNDTIFQNIWERLLWKFSKKYCLIKLQPTSLNSVCPVTILNLSFALTFSFDINLQIFLSTLLLNLANTNFSLPLRISKSLS